MLGCSEIVVVTSIASYDPMHAHGAETVRCHAPAFSEPPHLSMTLHATCKGDFELRLPQERVKYAVLGGSEVVVGISIASYTT